MKKIILLSCLIIASLFFIAPASAEYVCTDNLCYYHGDFQIGFYEPTCGNNMSETGEQCDGISLPARNCYEFLGNDWVGDLKCKSDCKLDITSCRYTKVITKTETEYRESKSSSSNGNTNSNSKSSSTQPSEITINPGLNTIVFGKTYIFYANSEQHRLWLRSLTENSAILGVASEEQEIELGEGELQEINLNEDPSPDIRLRLNSVNQSSAEINLEILSNEAQTQDLAKESNPSIVKTVVYLIAALLVVALVTVLFMMRKRNGSS